MILRIMVSHFLWVRIQDLSTKFWMRKEIDLNLCSMWEGDVKYRVLVDFHFATLQHLNININVYFQGSGDKSERVFDIYMLRFSNVKIKFNLINNYIDVKADKSWWCSKTFSPIRINGYTWIIHPYNANNLNQKMIAPSQNFQSQKCTWNTSNTWQPSATLYAHRYLGQEKKLHQLYLTLGKPHANGHSQRKCVFKVNLIKRSWKKPTKVYVQILNGRHTNTHDKRVQFFYSFGNQFT